MKKTLRFTLLSMLMMLCGTVFADESKLTFTEACNGTGTADDGVVWAVTSDGDESNFDKTKGIHYGTNSKAVGNITLTTSGISGTITSVVVNASVASGVTATVDVTVGGNAFGGDAQDLSATAADYTFEGSASGEIVVTVKKPSSANKALYVKSIVVTYADGETPPTPTVIYTVAGTEDLTGYNWDATQNKMTLKDDLYQWTAKNITVTNSNKPEFKVVKTEGENQTWYPNDGNWVITPDYLGAEGIYDITITFDAEKTEIGVSGTKTSLNTIAELNALENNKTFTFFGEALVVAKPTDKYVYIKDATGSSLIYDKNSVGTTNAVVGKTIAANWTGKVNIFNNLFELVPDEAIVVKEGDAVEVAYPEVTVADITADNVNKVVTLKGITAYTISGKNMTINVGEAAIVGYNQFGLEIAAAKEGKTYEMVGVISRYNDNIRFQPIEIKEVVEPEPVLNIDITNASFEADGEKAVSNSVLELTGWTFAGVPTGANVFNNTELRGAESASTTSQFGHSAPSDGNYSLFFRSGWNGSGNTITITSDALTELPAGAYTLSVDYKQHYSYDNTQNNNTHVALSLKNGETTMATIKSPAAAGVNGSTADATYFNDTEWSTLELPFTIAEAITGTQVVITLNAAGQRRSDFFIDNVKLVKVPAIQVALAELKKAIEAAEAKAATYTVGEGLFTYAASEIEPLTQAIATAQAAYEAAESAEAVEAATTTLNAFVETFAPEMTVPAADKTYTFQLRLDGETPLYMALAEGGITIAEEATPLKFIETETAGQYNLANADETLFVGLAGGNAWTMSTAADKKAAWTFTALPDGAYRINNLVTTACFVGTNAADKEAGKPCYADKLTSNGNVDWIIAEVKEEPVINYYLVGNMTNWEVNADYKMTRNAEAENEEYMFTMDLTTASQFKVVKVENENQTWYPDGMGNAYGENGEITADGNYTIYFRPNADGGEDWYYNVIHVAQNITDNVKAIKTAAINGTIYNLNGQQVQKAQKGLYIINGKKVIK